jgi:hypothetical protein
MSPALTSEQGRSGEEVAERLVGVPKIASIKCVSGRLESVQVIIEVTLIARCTGFGGLLVAAG